MPTNDIQEDIISIIESQPSIGRFTSIKRINDTAGDGTFSFVFNAYDESIKKEVVIKVHNILPHDIYRDRCFEREARILEKLKDVQDMLQLIEGISKLTISLEYTPIRRPIDIGFPYIVTDSGIHDIKKYIYSKHNKPIKNLKYFRTMTRAVQRIHKMQICHRDIKPDNFLLIKKKGICLADFGTATCYDGTEQPIYEDYNGWRGDTRYTAPEMCAGFERPELFFKADIFSLGAILFEMFTKTTLTTEIFNPAYYYDLLEHFKRMPPLQREHIFSEIIPDIAATKQLPDIFEYSEPIPSIIRNRLNQLYKGMANLDHRYRITDFESIFEDINYCVLSLEHEYSYNRLLELRKEWAEKRRQHLDLTQTR